MTRRADIPKYIVGDVASDGENTGDVKMSYPRKEDGQQWPIVHVTSGPLTGRRVWPKGSWRPLIDWSPSGSVRRRCAECEREFKQPTDGTMLTWCQTCQRQQDRADAQTDDGTAEPSHQFGRREWRRGRG